MTAVSVVDHAAAPGWPGCEFALCGQEAEVEVEIVGASVGGWLPVCGLHLTPVLTWGKPMVTEPPRIRNLVRKRHPGAEQAG